MGKRDLFNLTQDSRKNFKRTLGLKTGEDGPIPAVFYFGKVYAVACERVVVLNKAWEKIKDATPKGERPIWDEATYEVGKAAAAGRDEVAVKYPRAGLVVDDAFPVAFRLWLARLSSMFPTVKVIPADGELAGVVDDYLVHDQAYHEKTAAAHEAGVRLHEVKARQVELVRTFGPTTPKGLKLSEALGQFCDHVKTKYAGPDGISGHGGVVLRRVDNLVEHLGRGGVEDVPLVYVTTAFIERWLHYWGNRPTSKRDKPVSAEWSKKIVATVRDFLRWLHRAGLGWKRPDDYEVLPVRVKETEAERVATPKTARYKRDHLAKLWEYATPRERVLICLGLNCGFGMGECAALTLSMLKLDKGVIRGKRRKTGIYCKWRLWPETVSALRWYLDKARPTSSLPYVFVSESGVALTTTTKGGHPKRDIPNAWGRLYTRIRKDHPSFPKLSYNKLRKTGASWFRKNVSAELCDVYLAHKSKRYAMTDHYSDPAFARMGRGLKLMREALSAMFTVADPFPSEDRKSNRSTSLGKIKEIRALRASGLTLRRVAAKAGVSLETVQRNTDRVRSDALAK